MKNKKLAARSTLAILGGLLVATGSISPAQANGNGFEVNCTSSATLNGATTISGSVYRTVSGVENYTFSITNSGSASCTVTILDADILTGPSATTDGSTVTIAPAATADFTIKTLSGGYSIAPTGGAAVTFAVDTDDCSLAGAGISSAPLLVGTAANFQTIGANGCSLRANYLQTANISLLDPSSDKVTGTFDGTYDGDFWTLNYGGAWANASSEYSGGAFDRVNGTIKDLYLTGTQSGPHRKMGSLGWFLQENAVVSRVSSSVAMTSNYSGNPGESLELGGLFTRMKLARIEYSTFTGSISWEGSVTEIAYSVLAGSLAVTNDHSAVGSSVILDSYGMARFSNRPAACNGIRSSFKAGGLLGFAFGVDVVRSYSSTTLQSVGACATPVWGGLVARAGNPGVVVSYASYWNSSSGPTLAVAENNPTPLPKYTSGLPEAVPVSASLLSAISTFVSREGSTAGLPGGADLAISNETTTTVTEQDYRWAIEPGNKQAFVFPNYTSATNYWTREHIADTTVAVSMDGRGMVLEGPVTAYPNLGRVWEVCSGENNGFPVLVWEERDCSGSGGGGSDPGSGSGSNISVNPAAAVAQLAKTGSESNSLAAGIAFAAGLLIAGLAALIFVRRKAIK